MSGLPWIKVATDLPEHPKAVALAKRLDDPQAWAWPVRLWMHCARFAPEGRFRDAAAVEQAVQWTGKAGDLAAALAAVRFLDRHGRAFSVHGWDEWALAHVERLRRDRERKQRERRKRRHVRGTSDGRPPDVRTLEEREREIERRGEESETSAGRPARAREGEEDVADDVERLRHDLADYLGREIGGTGGGDQRRRLQAQIERLGYQLALKAAKETAETLASKGDPIRATAALPGWLETVEVPEEASCPT
jgi:hypothetical protein